MSGEEGRHMMAVGIDLHNRASQVSYAPLAGGEPCSLSAVVGSAKFEIPTMLCKRKEISQWAFGAEAGRLAAEGKGCLVTDFLEKAVRGQQVEVDGESYEADELVILYVKKLLTLVSMETPIESVAALMFTMESLDREVFAMLQRILSGLPVPSERIFLQSYEESIYYYVVNQSRELWKRDVLVLDYGDKCLKGYRLMANFRSTPAVFYMKKRVFPELLLPSAMIDGEDEEASAHRLDVQVRTKVEEMLSEGLVSTAYLIGDGFDGDWAKETIKELCRNRRAFQGKNLYTKGACYGARERLRPADGQAGYVFLGREKLRDNVGIQVADGGETVYCPLVDAGVSWHEAEKECDLILAGEPVLPILITPMDGGTAQTVMMELSGMPLRPARATRIRLRLIMKSENILAATVTDMGFGALYPASGKVWEREIGLREKEDEGS